MDLGTIVTNIVSNTQHDSMLSRCFAFSERLKEIEDESLKKDLKLLADVCSPLLGNEANAAGFVPHISLSDGRRSAIPEDFSDADLARLATLMTVVQDRLLKGRIADVLWYRKYGRAQLIEYRRIAIECYIGNAIDAEFWFQRMGRELYKRAVLLSRANKSDSRQYLQIISEKVQASLLKNEEPKLGCPLAGFLIENDLPGLDYDGIISVLEGSLLSPDLDILSIEDYRDTIGSVKKKAGDAEGALLEIVKKAKAVVTYVSRNIENVDSGILLGRLEPVLKELGNLPAKFRRLHRCDELVSDIRRFLAIAYRRGYEGMSHYQGELIDLSDQIKKVRESMRGLDPDRALSYLMGLYECDVKKISEGAKRIIDENPLLGIMPMHQVDAEGRPIGKEKGDENGCGGGVNWLIRHMYCAEIECAVLSALRPAHDVMREEHVFSRQVFQELVDKSDIVPQERRGIVSKALYYGYQTDYETSAYLLLPQLESILRSRLKDVGYNTRHDDFVPEKEGELSLSNLVAVGHKVFPESFAFELKTLFGRPPELNFRNQFLHGNIPDCNHSFWAFYIWWLIFKQVCLGTVKKEDETNGRPN